MARVNAVGDYFISSPSAGAEKPGHLQELCAGSVGVVLQFQFNSKIFFIESARLPTV
jgi:hypothetical protein